MCAVDWLISLFTSPFNRNKTYYAAKRSDAGYINTQSHFKGTFALSHSRHTLDDCENSI